MSISNLYLLGIIGLTASSPMANETHFVTDRMGRTVEIPTSVNRVATDFMPFPSAWYISTGSDKEIVGIPPNSLKMAERNILGRIAPSILKANTGFTQGKSVNVEELLKLTPDIFVSYESRPSIADVERIGIPVLALDVLSQSKGNVFDTYSGWMSLLGQVAGQEKRASEIIAYADGILKQTRAHVAKIPQNKRPGALFFSRLGENSLKINGTGHFGHFWMTEAGTINLAPKDIPPLADINMEQVYSMDPEIIFISNFSPAKPVDLYENRIPGQDWSHVAAIKNRRVYKIPEGIFQWYPPSADAPLMLQWIAQKSHPEIFNTYKIEDAIRQYYSRYYSFNLTDKDITQILYPPF
ncbi:ABC transporter substrate-binding protein [Grimontia sp. NTOU-MAR1]|uniref:ABC transporter substrate-binding protein n=1 Tax=Grimontia sp. NTOU-MAR1 TaxID=3111011 RepID=UPI002DB96C3B|nr:ABC transporter substrate-binding protein [Grimontia sp. NTOU-MAR1]WRV98371.1 ABC transporter substrate-binding protein [Grimontia sp. NTOU-MAR1]